MENATAMVLLDGQELTLLFDASIKKSKDEAAVGDLHRSTQYLILADKLSAAKQAFHLTQYGVLSEKYLRNEEKPAGEQQTSQANIVLGGPILP